MYRTSPFPFLQGRNVFLSPGIEYPYSSALQWQNNNFYPQGQNGPSALPQWRNILLFPGIECPPLLCPCGRIIISIPRDRMAPFLSPRDGMYSNSLRSNRMCLSVPPRKKCNPYSQILQNAPRSFHPGTECNSLPRDRMPPLLPCYEKLSFSSHPDIHLYPPSTFIFETLASRFFTYSDFLLHTIRKSI